MEIKWMALENYDATRVGKEHGYIAKQRKRKYTDEEYKSNSTLCNSKKQCSEDGETGMDFDEIKDFNEAPTANTCKKCLKIITKNKQQN